MEWYNKGAEQGDRNAQYSLGQCYEYGYGVEQDYDKAIEWYKKASLFYSKAQKAIERCRNEINKQRKLKGNIDFLCKICGSIGNFNKTERNHYICNACHTEYVDDSLTKYIECNGCGNRDLKYFIQKDDGYFCKRCGILNKIDETDKALTQNNSD